MSNLDNGSGGQLVEPIIVTTNIGDGVGAIAMKPDARSMRAFIFSATNKRLKRQNVMFYGVEVEVRQSTIGEVFNKRKGSDEEDDDNVVSGVIQILLDSCYVPGTDEKLFDESNIEELSSMGLGADFRRVMDTYNSLMGMDVKAEEKNSEKTLSANK